MWRSCVQAASLTALPSNLSDMVHVYCVNTTKTYGWTGLQGRLEGVCFFSQSLSRGSRIIVLNKARDERLHKWFLPLWAALMKWVNHNSVGPMHSGGALYINACILWGWDEPAQQKLCAHREEKSMSSMGRIPTIRIPTGKWFMKKKRWKIFFDGQHCRWFDEGPPGSQLHVFRNHQRCFCKLVQTLLIWVLLFITDWRVF